MKIVFDLKGADVLSKEELCEHYMTLRRVKNPKEGEDEEEESKILLLSGCRSSSWFHAYGGQIVSICSESQCGGLHDGNGLYFNYFQMLQILSMVSLEKVWILFTKGIESLLHV